MSWSGEERRKLNLINLSKLDKLEDTVSAMHGDVKVLVNEVKRINGNVSRNSTSLKDHCAESNNYRHRVDIIWSAFHTIKWAIGLMFGAGLFWKLIEMVSR